MTSSSFTFLPRPQMENFSSGPPSKKAKKSAVPHENSIKDYLKIQLNIAQTKITSQDAKLKKQEETISILYDRVRLLELDINSQLVRRHFPEHQPPVSSLLICLA